MRDIFEQAADQIITERGALKPKAYVAPEPKVAPPAAPHPLAGIKRSIRDILRTPNPMHSSDETNTITNRLYKGIVRPALARAYVLGFEAASEVAADCCGCNTYSDQTNPYDGAPL